MLDEEIVLPKHIHKFMRVKLGQKGFTVFKCTKPGCPTYYRVELIVGQFHECWRCKQPMVMNQWSSQFKKPHCRECTREHKSKEEEVVVTTN